MELECSVPHSQVPATCPFPEPDRSIPCPHIPLPEDPSSYYPSIYVWVFQVISFPQVSPLKPCVHLSSPPVRAKFPSYLILLDLITRPMLSEQYRLLTASLFIFFHSPVTSSVLCPNILLSTLFLNTLSSRSSLNVSDQVSHPYSTTSKTIVHYSSHTHTHTWHVSADNFGHKQTILQQHKR
jgi:hypothetical protein